MSEVGTALDVEIVEEDDHGTRKTVTCDQSWCIENIGSERFLRRPLLGHEVPVNGDDTSAKAGELFEDSRGHVW